MANTLVFKDGRLLEPKQRVRVYLNLNKGREASVFSIADHKSGLVVAYCEQVLISDVRFFVSPSGREKVRANKRKAVHAWAIGTLEACDEPRPAFLDEEVYYDPYKTATFVCQKSGQRIDVASLAHFENRRAWIEPIV